MTSKVFKNALMFAFLFMFITVMPTLVSAKTANISSQEDFKNALKDTEVDTIVLDSDINTTEKINITRPIYIDGKGHTMKYTGTFKGGSDKTVWDGIYLLQVYRTTATIKDIKLTGGNAGLLVNGSLVTLKGNVDVSGNGFGGIELGQGANVTEQVKLSLTEGAKIVNTTESNSAPTLWVPSDSKEAKIEANGITATIKSGEELELKEINQLIKNPETSDPLYLYIILNIIGILSLTMCFKKLKRN